MRDESCQPGFGIFIETLEQCDSQCVFDSDITGRVIHQFVSGLDISLRINFVQFVLRSKLVAAAFHFHRVDETGDRNELCLLSVGCVIFGFLHFTRESQFIALGEEYVKVFVTIGAFAQQGRDILRFVFLFSLRHLFRTGDVTVVGDTAILVHLQIIVAVQ